MKQESPISAMRGSDVLFPNYFWEDLLLLLQETMQLIRSLTTGLFYYVMSGVLQVLLVRYNYE